MEKNLTADMILQGATVFCGNRLPKDQDFIAIQGNRIIGIGPQGQEKDFIGEGTKVLRFQKEQFLMPGLHDHHIHLIQAGMPDKYADLTSASSQEEAAVMTADFAKTIPDDEWVMGFGWSRMSWTHKDLPTKESLDERIPEIGRAHV